MEWEADSDETGPKGSTVKNLILAALVLAIAVTADLASANNFNTINHDGWRFKMGPAHGMKDHNHQVVSSDDGHPVRYGKKSERFEVRPGDCGVTDNGKWSDCENDRERSEMTSLDDINYYDGDEYWYRWSIFFPNNHVNLYPVFITYGQFKQTGCKPVFSFINADFAGGKYQIGDFGSYINSSYDIKKSTDRYALLDTNYIDKWLDIVVYAKWSTSNDGIFRVWMNGKLKRDYKGRTMYCHSKGYFKYGIYRSSVSKNYLSKEITTVVYYDGIRISKTRDGMFEDLAE